MSSEAGVGTVLESILPGALSRSLIGPTCARATKQIAAAELRPVTVPTAALAMSLGRCPFSDRCRAAGRGSLLAWPAAGRVARIGGCRLRRLLQPEDWSGQRGVKDCRRGRRAPAGTLASAPPRRRATGGAVERAL